ncbi:glycoside hydrolase family 18 protein [Pseudoflavitalea sp. X16]|nr:glycoside hydrolase family 18 protein [Paraflavitalea devenefica]
MLSRFSRLLALLLIISQCQAQKTARRHAKQPLAVLAYYSGNASEIDQYDVQKLTHIIYSFCYLRGNQLYVGNAEPVIRKLVSLKKKQPSLKVLLSLGGWGGCKTCSDVFSRKGARDSFALSVKQWTDKLGTDGIDLDWEYPAIEGPPGHPYKEEDRPNFTELVKALRKVLGSKHEISFAAGAFTKCLEESIAWKEVMPVVDRVNLMTYDLVNGYSTTTGHHTALYSTPELKESTNNAVTYLESLGIPRNKMVIGAAFYARVFENVDSVNNGLYRPTKFKSFIPYRIFPTVLAQADGYTAYRDDIAKAPYSYNPSKKLFATYDDSLSVDLKTNYAIDKGLNGIMFWELTLDKPKDGLLDVIDKVKKQKESK